MNLFLTLLLAHLIADFPLQTDWIFRIKVKHGWGILLHAAIHSLVTAALIQNPLKFWPVLAVLWLAHAAVDWLKLYIQHATLTPGFLLDQLAHILTLVVIAYFAPQLMGALAAQFLAPLLIYALIPALLMLLSVVMLDLNHAHSSAQRVVQYKKLSQITGYPLILAVIIIRFGL